MPAARINTTPIMQAPQKNPTPVDKERIDALVDDLVRILGPRGVGTSPRALGRAARDESSMSPILAAQHPLGWADIVCYPTHAEQIPVIVSAAVSHGVPITARGKGTGNYGQAVPRFGGLVIDMTSLTAVVAIDRDTVTAEAGTRMVTLEQVAWNNDKQLWMYPSTAQSTLGGFLSGGSGGTGTIVHGRNDMGFVEALDVVFAHADAELVHLEGADAQPMVHTYGVAGIVARATVRWEPLQHWLCVYASFADHPAAFQVARSLRDVRPAPRLCSTDSPTVVNALPTDPAIVRGRASMRGIFDASVLGTVTGIIETGGGRVEAVRDGLQNTMRVSTLSYNHPTWWLQRAHPGKYFHMEVRGDALVDRLAEVEDVYDGGVLHLEIGHNTMVGTLNGIYRDPQSVYEGVPKLEALGVGVHSPHQSYVDRDADRIKAIAATTDPRGLLNPGRWLS